MTGVAGHKWSVLVLCTGFGNSLLKSLVTSTIGGLGFDVHVYDAPGYPVDPTLHSHAACIHAIDQHDIVFAFADEREGGQFQTGSAPLGTVSWLQQHGVLSTDPHAIAPTVFERSEE